MTGWDRDTTGIPPTCPCMERVPTPLLERMKRAIRRAFMDQDLIAQVQDLTDRVKALEETRILTLSDILTINKHMVRVQNRIAEDLTKQIQLATLEREDRKDQGMTVVEAIQKATAEVLAEGVLEEKTDAVGVGYQ